MTHNEMNMAICKLRGWKEYHGSRNFEYISPDGTESVREDLPDHINGIEALGHMHEAEKALTSRHGALFEFILLHEVHKRPEPFDYNRGDIMAVITSTAAQRAEALLRTLGKWEE